MTMLPSHGRPHAAFMTTFLSTATLLVAALGPTPATGAWQVGTPAVPELHGYRPADYDGPIEQHIEIQAARREIEPFMLYVVARDAPARGVTITVSELEHAQGRGTLGAARVTVAPLAYVKTATVGSTDPSLAGETAAMRRARIAFEPRILRRDIRLFDVPSGCQQAVWVNVDVPADAEPGDYAGTVTVRAADRAVDLPLKLHVRRFVLPPLASMPGWSHWSGFTYDRERIKTYDFTEEEIDRVMRMMLRYRWRATRLYQKQHDSMPLPDVAMVRRWAKDGATDINLLRVDVAGDMTTTDPKTGRVVYKDEVFAHWWQLLDDRVARIGEAGLLDRCMIYGFDERPRREVIAIDDTFRRIKQRYGDIPTMACSYIWTALEQPELEHVDIMGYVTRLLSVELRDLHHARDQKIFWYNMSRVALLPGRVQFWATFKDNLDGLLFYSMRADSPIKYVADEPFPLIDKVDHGPLHHLPDGPASTTILETWREGFDDADYLHLLAAQIARVRALGAERTESESIRKLLAQAEYYGGVPESITAGKFAEARIMRQYNRPLWPVLGQEETYVVQTELLARLETDSMAHLMYVRRRIAELIEQLSDIE